MLKLVLQFRTRVKEDRLGLQIWFGLQFRIRTRVRV